jgi:transposase
VIPFGLVSTPMRATYHNAAFLARVFPSSTSAHVSGDRHRHQQRGLGRQRSPRPSATSMCCCCAHTASSPWRQTSSRRCFRAIFTEVSARVQLQAAVLGGDIAALDAGRRAQADAINLATVGPLVELWKKR